jgi:ribosomal-protein-alanine N-acetyltransferase
MATSCAFVFTAAIEIARSRMTRRVTSAGQWRRGVSLADTRRMHSTVAASTTAVFTDAISAPDWQQGLPLLVDDRVTLREVQLGDAAALLTMLTSDDVSRFISPPPMTIEGFERFIICANAERAAGRYACFGVIPRGMESPIGIFQVRPLEPKFFAADWGFAIGSPFWGTGVFRASAEMVLAFAFETLGVHRLEARSVVANGRGNGALRKVGAVCEGVLRRSLLKNGEYHDQHLWSILVSEWRMLKRATRVTIN